MLTTDVQARKWKPAKSGDRMAFGQSLYLRGFADGTRTFEFRTNQSWVPLGNYPYLTLEQARAMVPVCKRLLKSNQVTIDGLRALVTRTQKAHELEELANQAIESIASPLGMPSFDEAYYAWYKLLLAANTWTHEASKRRPISVYENHAKRHIGNLRLDQIRRPIIKAFIQPLFLTHPETASSLLGYISKVLERAYDDELIDGNPCPSEKSFTKPRKETKHSPSASHTQLPDIWRWLEVQNFSHQLKVAMRLAMVTAHRASVIALMRKDHYDRDTGIWTIPKKNIEAGEKGLMKAGGVFAVKLPNALMADLQALVMSNNDCKYVFSLDGLKPIHPESLRRNFQKFGAITTHGFRNTFKTWCLHNDVEDFLADRYVDHERKGLDRSYRRDDLFQKRAQLMERYYDFIVGTA